MPGWVESRKRRCTVFLGLVLLVATPTQAVETVVFRPTADSLTSNGGPNLAGEKKSQPTRTVIGEVLVSSEDGGVMLLADDGRIWTIQPEQIVERSADDKPLVPVDADTATRRILEELPAGFTVYRTANYSIIHNTNESYVRHVGTLFEQLYRGFYAFWKNQRWELPPPRFPLVALVFANHNDFLKYATADIGDTGNSVIGYYHLATNRMTTFDVPNLERNIATIIHEATHQLAYNVGMQRRYADNPMWVSEGLATFFEAPDFSNPRGWRTIGQVNQVNLARWKKYLPNRPGESLATLLSDDTRFRNPSTTNEAYAECWALTYFLIKTRRDEYVAYLKRLSEGRPLSEKTARERIEMFEQSFGTTLVELDRQFLTYMQRLR